MPFCVGLPLMTMRSLYVRLEFSTYPRFDFSNSIDIPAANLQKKSVPTNVQTDYRMVSDINAEKGHFQ